MAERKAKEYAIDAAFTKYLADEQKKQEEKERLKEQTRRERGMYMSLIVGTKRSVICIFYFQLLSMEMNCERL